MSAVAVLAALATAASYAASSVLQQRSAALAPAGRGLHLGLLGHLVTRRGWLTGQALSLAGTAFHAVALAFGTLVVVQPLLVAGLLFALPGALMVERRRPSLAECGWALLLVVSLGGLLVAADPGAGAARPDDGRLLVLGALVLAGAGVLVALGAGPAVRHRAALLGAATGAAHGLTAGLMKYAVALGGLGLMPLLTGWATWAMVAVGMGAMALNQAAFQAGPLAGSLPALTIADPLVATAIGVLAFSETLDAAPAALAVQVVCGVGVTVGIVALARRTVVAHPACDSAHNTIGFAAPVGNPRT